jgi:nucleoside-diphosphate-sugar epimerase
VKLSVLGCGWLGLPLARELVTRGHAVRGSVTSADKLAALEEASVGGHRLELTPTLEGDVEEFFETNVLIITLPPKRREPGVEARYPAQIAAALAATPPETHIIFTGSTSVYPELNRTVTEEDAGGEIGPSGRAVLAAETLLRERGATILRLAGLYGYDRQPGRSLAGQDVQGGEARVNLVHRDDVLRVILQVIEEDVRATTLNVCADRHPTRRVVYTRQAERFGFVPPRFVEPHERDYKLVSSEKLKGQLGFTFSYPDPLSDAP